MAVMKKITSILLTLTFVLYLGGIQAFYWVKMSVHKQEVHSLVQHNKIRQNTTVSFSFTSSEYNSLSWSEQNKEFTYEGQRYDIIEIQYCSDEIIAICYSDRDETNLVAAFSGFMKKMFSAPQHTGKNNTDIANNICKDYMPSKAITPYFNACELVALETTYAFVNVYNGHSDVWRPPAMA